MSDPGFAILCTPDGIVISAFGGSPLAAGTPLSVIVARDSRERLQQMLLLARSGVPQHSLLQMADGQTLEVHCAGEEGRTLVLSGATPAAIRRRCEEIADSSGAAVMARRIGAAAAGPDEFSVDLWSEVARVNNDLATAHRQLAKTNAELRWLNEQKNELLGMAAHDLRNPLAVVLGYSQFIAMFSEQLSPEHRSMLGRIEANVRTMLAIVEDVLDFSAIESGTVRLDLTEFPLADLVSDVAGVNAVIAARKDIGIAPFVDPDMPILLADRRKLSQVLNNLLTNAIKFSHAGSSISITAGHGPEHTVRIAVRDRGLGMSPEQTALLYQPFGRVGVQATDGEKSTGLGLAIVRRIVEAHLGKVEVESVPGAGTTFTVILPASSTVAAPPLLSH